MFVLSACTASAPPSPAVALGTLNIGILLPITESSIDADIGASQRRAADLYLKLKGGSLAGREVHIFYDDESALEPGINKIRIQQMLDKHVDLLMGGAAAATTYLLHDTAEAQHIVYFDTNASVNALTRLRSDCTPTCRSKYVFRTAPTSWQMSEVLGEWVSKAGQKDWYVVSAEDTFGTESAAAFTEGLGKNGGRATGKSSVPEKGGADWKRVVAAIKAQPTRNVFAAFITEDAEGFVTAWGAAGMGAAGYKLAGPGPLADYEVFKVTKQAALGATTSFPWSIDIDNADNRTFVAEFKKAYVDDETNQPHAPDLYASEMWNAMRMLEEALKTTKGDTKNTDALIAALESVSFSGVGGTFTMDKATHNPIQDVYIREAKASVGSASGVSNVVIDKIGSVKDPGQ